LDRVLGTARYVTQLGTQHLDLDCLTRARGEQRLVRPFELAEGLRWSSHHRASL
jgi:hypothetical protein